MTGKEDQTEMKCERGLLPERDFEHFSGLVIHVVSLPIENWNQLILTKFIKYKVGQFKQPGLNNLD